MAQLAQNGDIGLVSDLAGLTVPLFGAGAPASSTLLYNQYYFNTTNSHFYQNNTSTNWVDIGGAPAQANRYLALLTSDPVVNNAVNMSDAGFTEMTTGGYARQSVTFAAASAAYPSVAANTNLITFGPMGTTMVSPIQWVALVTVLSGTTGWFLASWNLAIAVSVNASQSIQIGIGQLILQGQ